MKTKLLLGLHCHQPVDNFDYVVVEAINKAYKPFFQTLSHFEDAKVSVHFSGWLLDFIRLNAPDLFGLLQDLSSKGAIEFLTGGFYEPILCSIPSKDRKKQIQKLSSYIEQYFDQTPKGLWLTERVWDNSITKDLVDLGLEFVVVDDYHFIQSGVDKDKLYGYYNTSEDGKILHLFPINAHLRYILPFKPIEDLQKYFKSINSQEKKAGIIFDDGEKFGLWPKTYEWVYEKKWCENFFDAVLKSEDVEFGFYADFIKQNKPEGFVYLKENSYMEMGEWSLDPNVSDEYERVKNIAQDDRFLKGGNWKDFLIKYYEADKIHKRVLDLANKNKDDDDDLMRAQFNDVLWHGVFGGLYLPNLRDVAYKYIYKSHDKIYADGVFVQDINQDGYDEVMLNSQELCVLFDSKVGAQMIEFGSKKHGFNYQNTLTRRKEHYHKNFVVQDPNDKSHDDVSTIHTNTHYISSDDKNSLVYDWYIKNSFIDHISDNELSLDDFANASFKEHSDLVNNYFDVSVDNERVIFARKSNIYLPDGVFDLDFKKDFLLENNKLHFKINLLTNTKGNLCYILEFNFHFSEYENLAINDKVFKENLVERDTNLLVMEDRLLNTKVRLQMDNVFDLYVAKTQTLSQSEAGVDRTTQGICVGLKFPLVSSVAISGDLEIF